MGNLCSSLIISSVNHVYYALAFFLHHSSFPFVKPGPVALQNTAESYFDVLIVNFLGSLRTCISMPFDAFDMSFGILGMLNMFGHFVTHFFDMFSSGSNCTPDYPSFTHLYCKSYVFTS